MPKTQAMAADEITVLTSLGNVVLYVEPDGWGGAFLLDTEGRAVREAQHIVAGGADLAACLGQLGVPRPEATQLARGLAERLPEHPSARGRLHALAHKVANVIDDLPL